MDEAAAPDMTIKIIGHQWFWCYEIDDFLDVDFYEKKALQSSVDLSATNWELAMQNRFHCSPDFESLKYTVQELLTEAFKPEYMDIVIDCTQQHWGVYP
jgi:hypothetical protein